MAFDALRLRNIIQLLGILCMKLRCSLYQFNTKPYCVVFHCALIVFAALQVHQTQSALVTQVGCISTDDFYYVVRWSVGHVGHSLIPSPQNCAGPGTLWNRVQPFLIVVPCVIALSLFVMMFWVKELYNEFGYVLSYVHGYKLRPVQLGHLPCRGSKSQDEKCVGDIYLQTRVFLSQA